MSPTGHRLDKRPTLHITADYQSGEVEKPCKPSLNRTDVG